MPNETLQAQSVQATMPIPLYGRARMSELYPELINDSEAVRIVGEMEMDFSKIESAFGEYGGVSYLSRARCIDAEVSFTPTVTIFLSLILMKAPQPFRVVLFGGWYNLIYEGSKIYETVCRN